MLENEKYTSEEKEKIIQSAHETAFDFTNEVFKSNEETEFDTFSEVLEDFQINWIFLPSEICKKIVIDAKIPIRHVSYKEAERQLQMTRER